MSILDIVNTSGRDKGRPKKEQTEPERNKQSLLNLSQGNKLSSMPYAENESHPRKMGEAFQKDIKIVCKLYEKLGIAYIQQFNVPTTFIPDGMGGGKVGYREKTGFDFIGVTIKNKEAIFIECKSTKFGEIQIGQDKVGIKKHQLDRLLWLDQFGFNCLILWEVRAAGCIFKIPVNRILDLAAGRKHFKLIDCEEQRIPHLIKSSYEGELVYDFLEMLS